MKKYLKGLLFIAALVGLAPRAHALTGPFVQITTGTLQPGTTNGFYTSAGRVKNMVVDSTFTFSGSTSTYGISSGTNTFNGVNNLTGEIKFNGVSPSTGMIPIYQAAGLAPKWAFTGKILQVVTISTGNAQKTSTSASYATTGLSGTFTAVQPGSNVLIFVQQVFGASGVAGTVCTARIHRDAVDVIISGVGDYTVAIDDSATESDSGVFMFGLDTGQSGSVTLSTNFARTAGSGTCIANSTAGPNTGTGAQMLVVEVGK